MRAVQSLDGNWNKNVRRLEKVYSKTDHTQKASLIAHSIDLRSLK